MIRMRVELRYLWRRALGASGHVAGCRQVEIAMVGRAGGSTRVWTCAPACPKRMRDALRGRRALENWTGHRGR